MMNWSPDVSFPYSTNICRKVVMNIEIENTKIYKIVYDNFTL